MIQPESDKVMDDNVWHPEKLIEEMLAHPLTLDDHNFSIKKKKKKNYRNTNEKIIGNN